MDTFGKVCCAISPLCPAHTMEDVKVRTCTGAFRAYFRSLVYILTGANLDSHKLISVAIILSFTVMEFLDYRRVNIDTSVIINHSQGEKSTVHLNVTYPRVSCYRTRTVYHSLSF